MHDGQYTPSSSSVNRIVYLLSIVLWNSHSYAYRRDSDIHLIIPGIFIFSSLFFFCVMPVIRSKKLTLSGDLFLPHSTLLRSHSGSDYFVTSSILNNYIMVPIRNCLPLGRINSCKYYHEVGHIINNDQSSFILYFPILLSTAALSILMAFDPDGIINHEFETIMFTALGMLEDVDPEARDSLPAFIEAAQKSNLFIFSIIPIFITLIIILSIRDREYQADLFASRVLGDRFTKFLSSKKKRENYTKRRSFDSALRRITHPSYDNRISSIYSYKSNLMTSNFVSGLFCILLFGLTFYISQKTDKSITYYYNLNSEKYPDEAIFSEKIKYAKLISSFYSMLLYVSIVSYISTIIGHTIRNNRIRNHLINMLYMTIGGATAVFIFAFIVFYNLPTIFDGIGTIMIRFIFIHVIWTALISIISIYVINYIINLLTKRTSYNFFFNTAIGCAGIYVAVKSNSIIYNIW